jgi:septum formation protein
VRPSGADEVEEGDPLHSAVENARRKATTVEVGDALVLGVDTMVALDGRIYGKPADPDEARATLQALSDRTHQVISGLALARSGRVRTGRAVTDVTFRALGEAMIEWYVDTGEWRDRAGGYAIQGRGAALVRGIDGDYLNVVGLPVAALLDLQPELLRTTQPDR